MSESVTKDILSNVAEERPSERTQATITQLKQHFATDNVKVRRHEQGLEVMVNDDPDTWLLIIPK